jgi:predicted small lipoprotein YifL
MSVSRFPVALLAAAASLALLTACGQKGPLYLRDNPPAGTKIPKPATPKPVPYPADVVEPSRN